MGSAQSSRQIIRDRFQRLVPRLLLLHSQVAQDAGLSEIALNALHVLALNDGAMYPSELSAQTGLPRSTVTRVLDSLEDAGYVSRTKASEDGRRSLITVNSDHVAAIGARFDLYADAMAEAARNFSAKELTVVARYWDVLGRTVDARQPQASRKQKQSSGSD
jgi:DNA-binding MarR family transcriptional regulator